MISEKNSYNDVLNKKLEICVESKSIFRVLLEQRS